MKQHVCLKSCLKNNNWFVSAPVLAAWNETTGTGSRRRVKGDKEGNKWSVGHRKINTTWQGCGNRSVALCSHVTSINQHVFYTKLWMVVQKPTSHLFLLMLWSISYIFFVSSQAKNNLLTYASYRWHKLLHGFLAIQLHDKKFHFKQLKKGTKCDIFFPENAAALVRGEFSLSRVYIQL